MIEFTKAAQERATKILKRSEEKNPPSMRDILLSLGEVLAPQTEQSVFDALLVIRAWIGAPGSANNFPALVGFARDHRKDEAIGPILKLIKASVMGEDSILTSEQVEEGDKAAEQWMNALERLP